MDYAWLASRFLFSSVFIVSAIGNLKKLNHSSHIAKASGAPFPKLLTVLASLLSLLGGISVVLGYRVDVGTVMILLFLVPVTFMTHRFWAINDPRESGMHQAHFWKNIGLAGGALFILYYGAGPMSLG